MKGKRCNVKKLLLLCTIVILIQGCTAPQILTVQQKTKEGQTTTAPKTSGTAELTGDDQSDPGFMSRSQTESPGNSMSENAASQNPTSENAASQNPTSENATSENPITDNITPPPRITDITSLDNTSIGWGIGKDTDEQNRPLDCLKNQEKYAAYEADFYKENSKSIYLTFDEGYEAGYTGEILDTLKEHHASAVFFITMQYAKEEPDLIRRMIDEGHILGNHSTSHPVNGMPSLSIADQEKDVTALQDYVRETYHYEMKLFRFPSGKFSEQSIAVMNNLGLKSIFWSFAHYDYNVNDQPDPVASLEKMKKAFHPGAIYLLHAVSSTDTQILGDLIEAAKAAGYPVGRYDEDQ